MIVSNTLVSNQAVTDAELRFVTSDLVALDAKAGANVAISHATGGGIAGVNHGGLLHSRLRTISPRSLHGQTPVW
jgi:hypothetical protein